MRGSAAGAAAIPWGREREGLNDSVRKAMGFINPSPLAGHATLAQVVWPSTGWASPSFCPSHPFPCLRETAGGGAGGGGPGHKGTQERSVVCRSGGSVYRSSSSGSLALLVWWSLVQRGPGELMNGELPATDVGGFNPFAVLTPKLSAGARPPAHPPRDG